MEQDVWNSHIPATHCIHPRDTVSRGWWVHPSRAAWSQCVPKVTGGDSCDVRAEGIGPEQRWGSGPLQLLRTKPELETSPDQAFLQIFIDSWVVRLSHFLS